MPLAKIHVLEGRYEIRRNVILGVLLDLSPLGTTLEISPCQVAQRLLGRGNEALRTQAVQIERRLARAGFLHAHEPFQIIGEAKPRWIIGQLRIKQRECALPAHPELPFPVVRILVQVLLDRYRAVRRFLGVFLFDLVTRGRSRRLRGDRRTADADTAGNKQADPRCSNLHFLAPLIRSRD